MLGSDFCPSINDEERSELIRHKEVKCSDLLWFVSFELVGIALLLMGGIIWVLVVMGFTPIPNDFILQYQHVAIYVFLGVDAVPILVLIVQIYRKWWKLHDQVTLVGDVEIFHQTSKKRLEIKRNSSRKHRRNSPNSSSSYFSISELPVGTLCPGLISLVKRMNDPKHVPVPFLKWKQGCEADYLLKVTLIGDSGTGKTSFRESVSGNPFSRQYQRTFGVDFCALYWEYQEDGKHTRFHITLWDTDGHYDTNCSHFRVSGKSANCVALMYSIIKPDSLYALKTLYTQIISLSLGKEWPYPPKFVVLANMIDKDKEWKLENDQIWLRKNLNNSIPIVPISCANGHGISKAAEVIILAACGLVGQGGDPESD